MMKNISHHDQDMSNLTSASNEAISASSTGGSSLFSPLYNFPAHHLINQTQPPLKKKRNQPGHPDPEAEVISLSPRSLLATNRFVCDVCHKGFQRDQNLQLHRRGHNLPWKLKQRSSAIIPRKKVYVCPETSCVHHDPSRALGDLTGVKKHFSRKHGEKKWKCDKCSKKYAVQSDWKAHSKICGTREYRCDCGTLFSRRDSFITHRAFCDALAQESAMRTTTSSDNIIVNTNDEYHRIPVKKEVLQAGFTAMSLKPPADFPLPLVPLDNIQPSVFHYFHQNPNPNVGPGTNHISATSSSPLPTYGHYYNNHDNINQPSSLYYDMMMMGSGESLEFHAALDEFRMSRNEVDDRGSVVEGCSGETTRDFLGLRGLSESDYMSIAGGLGFSSCMGTRNASTHNL